MSDDPFSSALVKKNPTPQKMGSSGSDPFATAIVKPNDPTQEGDELTPLGKTFSYIDDNIKRVGNFFWNNPDPAQSVVNYAKNSLQAGNVVANRLVDTAQSFYNSLDKLSAHAANTPIDQLSSEALGGIKDIASNVHPVEGVKSLPEGLLNMFVNDPIGAATQTKNVNGVALPTTPEELADKYQSVAGTLAAGEIAKTAHEALLATKFSTAADAIAASNQSGLVKAGKVIGSDLAASSAAGLGQGLVAGLGHDDNLAQAVAGVLTFAPLGLATGIFGIKGYSDKINEAKGKLIRSETGIAAQDLAALNALKITSNSTLEDLSASMESIMKTKNWVKAAILKRFNTGQGYIIDGITDDKNLPVVPKGSFTYHSPASNSVLVTPFKLGSASETFFKKNGFMPREVVNFGGDDYFVLKESSEKGQLVVKNINNGRENVVPIEALRRNNTSMVSSSFMAHMSDVTSDTKTYNSLKDFLQNKAPDSRGYQEMVDRATKLEQRVGSGGGESIADIVRKNRNLKAQDIEDRKRGYTPEKLKAAAIKVGDQVFRGSSHFDAIQQARARGVDITADNAPQAISGYITDKGRFVTDVEGTEIADKAGQFDSRKLKPEDEGVVSSEHLGLKDNHIPNAPDEAPQDLSKLIPDGNPGVDMIDSGNFIKVVNRDANGKGNGILTLQKTGDGKANAFTLYVDPAVRRQGIASSLYDAAEKAGYTIDSRQSGLSDQGRAFVGNRESNNNNNKVTSKVLRDERGKFVKPVNPVEGTLDQPVKVIRAGLVNPENYLNGLTQRFTTIFKNSDKPFNVLVDEFAKQYGITDQDKIPLQSAIYKRLSTDLSSELLSKEEIQVREKLKNELEEANKSFIQESSRRLDAAALTNGMYVDSEGGGKYRIRSQQDGSVLKTVGSPDEAFNYIKEATQSNFVDLDGGSSGGVPTALGNLGGMGQPYRSRYTDAMKAVDLFRLGSVTRYLVPSVRMMGIVDNITGGATSFLKDVMLKLQEAQNLRRNFTSTLDPLTTKLNAITNLSKNVTPDRLQIIGDNVTTRTPDEIQSGLLSRPMFKTEVDAAKKWFKNASTKDVSDLLYSAKSISGARIGTPEFEKTLFEVGQNYSKEVVKAAKNLSASAGNFDPKDFSPYAVLKLAKAIEDPATALSRQDHAMKYNLTTKEVKLANALIDYYKDAFQFTNIEKDRQISGYLPDIVLHNAVDGRGSVINPLFARELTRIGITPKNLTEQNPIVAARAYHYGLINHASGFSEMVRQAQDAANKNIEALNNIPDDKLAKYKDSIKEMVNRHIDDVMGRKSPTEFLTEISKSLNNKLFNKVTPDVGSVMELFSLSKIALRFGLSIRDAHAALGRTYINLGPEFAKEAFFGSLDGKYLQDLHEKGIFGKQDLQNILDPTSSEKLLSKESLLGKVAGAGFKASGQEMVYNRSLAGIYKATMKIGARELERLKKNEITKEEAYDRLGLDNYGPSVTQIFDNMVSAGRPDRALDFLGQMHGRTMSTIFGNNNNPIGWNSSVGKLLSQYGYWATNASNTLLESATYGNKSQIAKRMLRTGIIMGATAAAGNELGVDLHTWLFANPFEVMPGTGPLANVVRDTYRTYAKDPNMFSASMKTIGGLAADFVPFSSALKDWQRAYDANNPIAAILATAPRAQ